MSGPIPLQRSFSPTSKLSSLCILKLVGRKKFKWRSCLRRTIFEHFRIIATAYLLEAMPQPAYLNPPKEPRRKYLFWLPSFCYHDKPLTDEEVFRTKHRNSDFNIFEIIGGLRRCLTVLSMEITSRETHFA